MIRYQLRHVLCRLALTLTFNSYCTQGENPSDR